MAIKIKADLIFEYNLLPIYFDDGTKEDKILSEFDYSEIMDVINLKNNNEFQIKVVSLDFNLNRIAIFSELFYSETQIVKTWEIIEFTAPQQTVINNFIDSL